MKKNIILKTTFKPEEINWSRNNSIKAKSNLHSISSYLGMFTPAMAEYFITKHTKPNDVVFDPFSGRGTTALTSRLLNRKFYGSDLNPYAFVLSKAKISNFIKEEAIDYITNIEKDYLSKRNLYIEKTKSKDFAEMKIYYHKETLSQLIFLREKVGKNWTSLNSIENFVISLALGLMHGKPRKDNSTIYFSVSMPNTISMSPNYVKKYVQKHKLKKPKVNIFEKIQNRLEVKYEEFLIDKFDSKIKYHDCLDQFDFISNESVDLLFTSPPYLNIVDYTKSNWLRLWLLGFERKNLKNEIKLNDKHKFDDYCIFITKFLNNIYDKIKQKGKVCLVVGDIKDQNLIEDVWLKIAAKTKFKALEVMYDQNYKQSKKITNMLNKRKGKATKIEKILVLFKD